MLGCSTWPTEDQSARIPVPVACGWCSSLAASSHLSVANSYAGPADHQERNRRREYSESGAARHGTEVGPGENACGPGVVGRSTNNKLGLGLSDVPTAKPHKVPMHRGWLTIDPGGAAITGEQDP